MAPARWRMLDRPKPSRAESSGRCCMPMPSSATASVQCCGLVAHGDAHQVRARVPHGVADRLLGDAQQFVLVLRPQPRDDAAAVEGAGHPARDGGAVRQLLAVRSRVPRAASGRGAAPSPSGAPRRGRRARARGCSESVLASSEPRFLQEGNSSTAPSCSRMPVKACASPSWISWPMRVRSMSTAVSLAEYASRVSCTASVACCTSATSRPLLEDLLGRAREGERKETDAAGAEHQGVDHRALGVLMTVKGKHAGPDLRGLATDVEVDRFTQVAEASG